MFLDKYFFWQNFLLSQQYFGPNNFGRNQTLFEPQIFGTYIFDADIFQPRYILKPEEVRILMFKFFLLRNTLGLNFTRIWICFLFLTTKLSKSQMNIHQSWLNLSWQSNCLGLDWAQAQPTLFCFREPSGGKSWTPPPPKDDLDF